MQSSLALANPSARHPVRRALPAPAQLPVPSARDRAADVRLFAMTFVAGFIAFYGMIV